MAGRVYARDGLGRFRRGGRTMKGKKVRTTRGLGRARAAKKDTGTLSAGGKIAGMDPKKAAKKITGAGEDVTSGDKLKR